MMCEDIKQRLYIKFIFEVLIFRVLWPITQVYNEIGMGISAARASSRYGWKWRIDW